MSARADRRKANGRSSSTPASSVSRRVSPLIRAVRTIPDPLCRSVLRPGTLHNENVTLTSSGSSAANFSWVNGWGIQAGRAVRASSEGS